MSQRFPICTAPRWWEGKSAEELARGFAHDDFFKSGPNLQYSGPHAKELPADVDTEAGWEQYLDFAKEFLQTVAK